MRRERPGVADGAYVFRSFAEKPFSTSGLALPSSHGLVAFSAAWILCRLYPRAWPIWVALAAGCALSRVEAHAHFLSDVTVAAVAAWFMVEMIWRQHGAKE
jgi:membrane-associated phospholipid phosphatase